MPGGPAPFGPFAGLPGKRPRDEGQPDGRAVRRQCRCGPGHEVIRVDDNRGVSPGLADGGLQLAQPLQPDRIDVQAGVQRVAGRCDLLGTANTRRPCVSLRSQATSGSGEPKVRPPASVSP
jgi:hypothetical protein